MADLSPVENLRIPSKVTCDTCVTDALLYILHKINVDYTSLQLI